ncbi:MAG: hypothetical protein PHD25_05725 [Bacteroidales bacterium]|nr:hypothetical protein [Bacteroidales bacterium]
MISPRHKKMLRSYLEGDLAEKERKQFEIELSENNEWRDFLEEMKAIDRILSEPDTSAPQADLLDPIMNAIRQNKDIYAENPEPLHEKSAKNTWQNALNRIFPNPQWNVAWGFIAGMVIGVAVMSLFHLKQPSETVSEMDATGSLATRDTKGTVLLPVDLPEIKLNLTANPLPQNYTQLNLEVISGTSSIIQLMFNTTSFQIWSLRSMESKPGCQIMAGYNYIEIGNQGHNSYVILLKKLTTIEEGLTVSIFLDGNLEFNTQVKL